MSARRPRTFSVHPDYANETDPVNGTFAPSAVRYVPPGERHEYEVFVKNGRLVEANGRSVDCDYPLMFVMSLDYRLYVGVGRDGKFHHSSLLAAEDVLAAGEMGVRHGKIVWVNRRSGHYAPTAEGSRQFMKELQRLGVMTGAIQWSRR